MGGEYMYRKRMSNKCVLTYLNWESLYWTQETYVKDMFICDFKRESVNDRYNLKASWQAKLKNWNMQIKCRERKCITYNGPFEMYYIQSYKQTYLLSFVFENLARSTSTLQFTSQANVLLIHTYTCYTIL